MSAGSDRAIQSVPNRNSVEFATNARAIGGFVRWMTRDIDSQRTDRIVRVPLSGAQAAALLRIGGEPMRETERADGGTNGAIVGAAAHGATAHQAPASRAAGRITLAVLGLMGFSVLVQVNSEQVPPNAPQSSGLVGRAPDTGASHLHDTLQGHHKMLNKITGVTAAAVVGIAATVAGAQSGAVQWKVEDGGNGHWYAGAQLPNGSSPANRWDAASLYCGERGGHLATPTSESENDFIVANAVTQIPPQSGVGRGPMLGGRLETNGWQWIDGEPWSYSGWCGSEPTGDGIHLHYWAFSNLCWNDFSGTDAITNTLIVEWSADCNNDNIIDYGQCHNGTLADYNTNNIPDCCELGETCVVSSYPVQWRVEDGGNGHWYDQQTWIGPKSIVDISASYVALIGAHAVTITSASENEFVYRAVHSRTSDATHAGYSILGGYQDVGASDYSEPAGGWRWVTGEPMTYLNWGPGFPDNCCYGESVLQYPSASYWNDAETAGVPAGHRYRVIIEWEADCNNDNIVDYGQILTGQLADANTNGIPDICEGPTCQDADITNNQIIDGADLGAMLAFWGPVNPVLPQADINHDGEVNGADLSLLLSFWGPCP